MFDDKQFFCITYSTATGGNHLANLLTTNDTFYPRFPSINYLRDLELAYEEKTKLIIDTEKFEKKYKIINWRIFNQANISQAIALAYNVHFYKPITKRVLKWEPDQTIDGILFKNLRYINDGCSIHGSYEINKNYNNFIGLVHHFDFLKTYKSIPNQLLQTFAEKLINKNVSGILIKIPTKKGRAYKRLFGANKFFTNNNHLHKFNLPIKEKNKVLFDNENCLEIDSDIFFEKEGSYYIQEIFKKELSIDLPNLIHKLHEDWIIMIDNSLKHIQTDE